MAIPLSVGLRTLFLVMACAMSAILIYTSVVAGSAFIYEFLAPWAAAAGLDFFINIAPLATWICYKESNAVTSIVWIILIAVFGCAATASYLFIQFLNLSPEEASQDPLYHVLLRHQTKDGLITKRNCSPVVTARIIFTVLGCLMLVTLIYITITHGSHFREELLTPWLIATSIDIYFHVVILSVWVTYKESSWMSAFLWIMLLSCFRSVATCVFIVKHLFQLCSEDPLFLVFLNNNSRAESRYERA